MKVTIFTLLALGICAAAPAQATTAGSARLDTIEIGGSTRFRSEQIAPETGLRLGANVTREELQAGADRLAKLGLFTGIQYRFTTAESGVRVSYQLKDIPTLPVAFDNFPWFSDEEITEALKSDVALFDGSAPARGAVLDEIAAGLMKLLETKRVDGTIAHAVVTSAGGAQVQQFRVEGTEIKVGSVDFSDALANSDRTIQTRVSDIVGKPFSRETLETFELEQVRPVYVSKGFLKVHFDRPDARFAGSDPPRQIAVVAAVHPGVAYTWNGVVWAGNSALQSGEMDKLSKLQIGEAADGLKIEALWQDVRDAYSKRGFLDANLSPAPQFEEATKRVGYSVAVTEGPQYKMGDLILTGLSPEGEKRIRTAWKIPSGALFDKTFYDQFIETGIKQAFAGLSYHYDKIGKFLQQDRKTGKVDVLLDFQ